MTKAWIDLLSWSIKWTPFVGRIWRTLHSYLKDGPRSVWGYEVFAFDQVEVNSLCICRRAWDRLSCLLGVSPNQNLKYERVLSPMGLLGADGKHLCDTVMKHHDCCRQARCWALLQRWLDVFRVARKLCLPFPVSTRSISCNVCNVPIIVNLVNLALRNTD